MFKKLFGRFKGKVASEPPFRLCDDAAPQSIEVEGVPLFSLGEHFVIEHRAVIFNWQSVYDWFDEGVPADVQPQAWCQCERAWLLHQRDCFGIAYQLAEDEQTYVLFSLEQRHTELAMAFIARTRKRIMHILQGIADDNIWGKNILIICSDVDDYFSYIAAYHPRQEEIARSSGIYINAGGGHFVTFGSDLSYIEPTIAHELTHSYLSHLPLPHWLNEGIAVNVEQRLVGRMPGEFTAQEMYDKHQTHWNAQTIQAFWSGEAFSTQATMSLAYDLATTIVMQLSKDWAVFSQFVLAAHWADAAAQAAQEYIGMSLGEYICLVLDKAYHADWEPAAFVRT